MLDLRHPGSVPIAAPGDRGDLIRGQAWHEAERREHLDVLFIERDEPAHRLLARLADIAVDADHQILAELPLLAGARRGVLVCLDRPTLHRRGAAADRALDVVTDHEIEPAR